MWIIVNLYGQSEPAPTIAPSTDAPYNFSVVDEPQLS
jgi:hypothetical protein